LGELAWAVPVAIAARLVFWAVTNRTWEDALITLAHARNAVEGLGLTAHPGEPVTQGFTSALSVLIPLAGEAVVAGSGLLVLRVVSLAAVVVALWAADHLLIELGVSVWPRRLTLAFLAVDPLQIFFGMAGMETQVAVAVLLVSAYLTTQRHSFALGVSLGFALLARPDFVLWVGPVLLVELVRRPRRALAVGAATAAMVAPWLIFTTAYYGTPVPQTIVAKSITYAQTPIADAGWLLVHSWPIVTRTYAPFYENSSVVAAPLPLLLAELVSTFVWVSAIAGSIAAFRRIPAVALFVGLYTIYRLIALPTEYFDWYIPPVAALGMILAAVGIDLIVPAPGRLVLTWSGAVLLAGALVVSLGIERLIQTRIEDGVRLPVALYLVDHAQPGDTVVTESAGYFGYYSRLTLYDYPGLTSRRALGVIRATQPELRTWETGPAVLVDRLQPTWFVARPHDLDRLAAIAPKTADNYAICRAWDAGTGDELIWGPVTMRTVDSQFFVLHRDTCP
jgi:hypothetical protein